MNDKEKKTSSSLEASMFVSAVVTFGVMPWPFYWVAHNYSNIWWFPASMFSLASLTTVVFLILTWLIHALAFDND